MIDLIISIIAGIISVIILIMCFGVIFKTAKESGIDLDDEVKFPNLKSIH